MELAFEKANAKKAAKEASESNIQDQYQMADISEEALQDEMT